VIEALFRKTKKLLEKFVFEKNVYLYSSFVNFYEKIKINIIKINKYDIFVLIGMVTLMSVLYFFELKEFVMKYIIVFMGISYFLGRYIQSIDKNKKNLNIIKGIVVYYQHTKNKNQILIL